MTLRNAFADVAQDGTDISSPTAMPAGGAGIRGWLSAIWTKLNGTLAVTGTFWQATQPISGTVTANAGSGTLAVSAASLPLPSGAAQDSTLTGGTQKTKLVDSGGTNVASVSAAGAVKVDNSANTQPVSGTVTANAGTGTLAVSGPLTDTQLRATAVPVSLSTITVTQGTAANLNNTAAQGAPNSVGNAWPTKLTDGTNSASVLARDATPASTDKGVAVVHLGTHNPGYQVVTTEITSATATGVKENLTLWHPSSSTRNVYIVEVGVNVRVVQTAGTFAWELQYITAENGTPGGTTLTAQQLNRGDAASDLTIRQVATGAPTTGGQIIQRAGFPLPAAAAPFVQAEGFVLFSAQDRDNYTDAIQFRASQAEGLRISQNVAATLTTAPIFTVYVKYVERA